MLYDCCYHFKGETSQEEHEIIKKALQDARYMKILEESRANYVTEIVGNDDYCITKLQSILEKNNLPSVFTFKIKKNVAEFVFGILSQEGLEIFHLNDYLENLAKVRREEFDKLITQHTESPGIYV